MNIATIEDLAYLMKQAKEEPTFPNQVGLWRKSRPQTERCLSKVNSCIWWRGKVENDSKKKEEDHHHPKRSLGGEKVTPHSQRTPVGVGGNGWVVLEAFMETTKSPPHHLHLHEIEPCQPINSTMVNNNTPSDYQILKGNEFFLPKERIFFLFCFSPRFLDN